MIQIRLASIERHQHVAPTEPILISLVILFTSSLGLTQVAKRALDYCISPATCAARILACRGCEVATSRKAKDLALFCKWADCVPLIKPLHPGSDCKVNALRWDFLSASNALNIPLIRPPRPARSARLVLADVQLRETGLQL